MYFKDVLGKSSTSILVENCITQVLIGVVPSSIQGLYCCLIHIFFHSHSLLSAEATIIFLLSLNIMKT
jgi:hypothetical protein